SAAEVPDGRGAPSRAAPGPRAQADSASTARKTAPDQRVLNALIPTQGCGAGIVEDRKSVRLHNSAYGEGAGRGFIAPLSGARNPTYLGRYPTGVWRRSFSGRFVSLSSSRRFIRAELLSALVDLAV